MTTPTLAQVQAATGSLSAADVLHIIHTTGQPWVQVAIPPQPRLPFGQQAGVPVYETVLLEVRATPDKTGWVLWWGEHNVTPYLRYDPPVEQVCQNKKPTR